MTREVAGEGGYGCVLKPSIHCTTSPKPGFNYDGYVSKIMKTSNAVTELAEFEIIGRLDPTNEYHLGKPILCRPKLDEPNVKRDIDKCKRIKSADIDTDPNNYSLLVLKDGGPDLKALCSNHLTKYISSKKKRKTDAFWLEVHHLIKGLQFFRDNGVIHYDLKPQNILFDLKNGSMKFIDFGLMKSKSTVINNSKNNINTSGNFHWSYPFDCGFMNRDMFEQYKKSKRRDKYKTELSELIIGDRSLSDNTLGLPIKKPEAFKILFTYLSPDNNIPDSAIQYGYINSFFEGFNALLTNKSYNEILDIFTNSIDVFGLGFTMQYMANCFLRHRLLSVDDFTRLSTFFYKMYDFNPFTRVTDLDVLLTEYENVLLQNGVLSRLHKSFQNHLLVDEMPVPTIVAEEISRYRPEHLSPELQAYANQDPIVFTKASNNKVTKRCPEDKELNPFTNRCLKKCNPGFSRNSKFQCRKNKTSKTKKHNKSRSNTNSSFSRFSNPL